MVVDTEQLYSKVLLVEDEDAHALLISRALKPIAAQIDRASSISEASDFLTAHTYDLVISDLQLPDSSGLKGVERIVNQSGTTPVVVLTSSRSIGDAVQALRAGARDYLVKEFDSSFAEVIKLSLARLFTTLVLEKEQARLQRETKILRVAIDNSTDIMAIVNRNGKVVYKNSMYVGFAKSCGADGENLIEVFTDRIAKADELRELIKQQLATMDVGTVWNSELSFSDDVLRAYDLSLSAAAGRQDNTTEDVCVVWMRDISELKRREKFQREILSTTSHDLKGPLGAISLSAELITDMTTAGEKPHELALRIGSAARGAINLIDEFLSARRIEEGTFLLKPSNYDVAEICEELKINFLALARPKRIDFVVNVAPATEAVVDKLGFSRVLGNLLSNAIKFTDKGGRVSLKCWSEAGRLIVEVEDTGTGMGPAEVQKIFERYGRLERHAAVAGSGIGLFVVKSIVRAHGGSIEVTSRIDKGTCFRLTFPDKPPVNERGELISLDFD